MLEQEEERPLQEISQWLRMRTPRFGYAHFGPRYEIYQCYDDRNREGVIIALG